MAAGSCLLQSPTSSSFLQMSPFDVLHVRLASSPILGFVAYRKTLLWQVFVYFGSIAKSEVTIYRFTLTARKPEDFLTVGYYCTALST